MVDESGQAAVIRKLEELRARFEAIEAEMNRPEVASNAARIVELTKEHGRLRRMTQPYEAYRKAIEEVHQAEVMLADPAVDEEMKALAAEEITAGRSRADRLMADMQTALVTSEDAAISSVILEIRAGTGGDEAALFARCLHDMYQHYCEKKGFAVELMDVSPSDLGGFKEVILNIKGPGVYQCLGYEGGGHRVQRVPVTETQGRIHTSAATVAVLPEAEEVDIEINPEDLRIDVFRSSGPGGQSVNTTDSAVRVTHVPTGMVVSCQDEKSQHKNRARAIKVLRSRLLEMEQQKLANEQHLQRRLMVGSGDRSERIRTYNFPQNRLTDHRINFTVHQLESIMEGELDEIVDALVREDRMNNLQEGGESPASR